MDYYQFFLLIFSILLGVLISTSAYMILELLRCDWELKKRIRILKIEYLYKNKTLFYENIIKLLWEFNIFLKNEISINNCCVA